MKSTQQLRKILKLNDISVAPGVFDGLTTRLAEQAGFEVIYASGGAIARSAGFPDIGLLSLSEVVARLEHMTEVATVPIIADADTGFGNSINAVRTIKLYEKIGVAGMHIEDQTFPKRCGHLNDKSLISTQEMVNKINSVKAAQNDPDFLLIARTDAIASEGFSSAIDRAHQYLAAGADMIFVEAPETVEQIQQIGKEIPEPKLINMFLGGKTPLVDKASLAEWGYKLIIIPSDLQRAAINACQKTLASILEYGDSSALAEELTSFSEREVIVRTAEYLAIK